MNVNLMIEMRNKILYDIIDMKMQNNGNQWLEWRALAMVVNMGAVEPLSLVI